jgi:exodeoxyribonuclease VII large subunit
MQLLTVSQINAYLRAMLEADEVLGDIWVQGEISNCKRASSGHYYFTLKDDGAALDVAMWRSYASRLDAPLTNGDAVLAHGRVSLYETSGRLQFYVDMVRPAGVGLLHARFEELKARLYDEGLFDETRKRSLPLLPRRIGVATSAESAARRDIETVLRRRFPLVEVLLAPCLVQGEQAPASIVQALTTLYTQQPDLIILARGGGSIEDLWSFNEEVVARAVFASPVPLISGVGHETDTTIVDYVADVRAPTPSAAAELAVPDAAALAENVQDFRQRLDEVVMLQLDTRRGGLDDLAARLRQQHPQARLARSRQQVDDMLRRVSERMTHTIELRRARLQGLTEQLAMLSPAATLRRGYAVVRRAADGQIVKRADQVQAGERLTLTLPEGQLTVEVVDPQNTDQPEGKEHDQQN